MGALTETKKRSSTDVVREVFADGVELTDAQLADQLAPEFHRGQSIPARIRLAKRGEVELARLNGDGHGVWRGTPPERRAEAKEEHEQRTKTPAEKLASRSPGDRAQVVAALLEDAEVNRILREQHDRGAAWRRSRARAHDAHEESEAERRQRKRNLKEAEKQKDRYLDFLKVHDGLRDAVAVLFGIRSFLREEVHRREQQEPLKIPEDRWPAVSKNLLEVLHVSGAVWNDLVTSHDQTPQACPLCGERIARDPEALNEGYIEADADEIPADDLIDEPVDASAST